MGRVIYGCLQLFLNIILVQVKFSMWFSPSLIRLRYMEALKCNQIKSILIACVNFQCHYCLETGYGKTLLLKNPKRRKSQRKKSRLYTDWRIGFF